jgi:hypothetical protein
MVAEPVYHDIFLFASETVFLSTRIAEL